MGVGLGFELRFFQIVRECCYHRAGKKARDRLIGIFPRPGTAGRNMSDLPKRPRGPTVRHGRERTAQREKGRERERDTRPHATSSCPPSNPRGLRKGRLTQEPMLGNSLV